MYVFTFVIGILYVNPTIILIISSNSRYCLLYNFYDVSLENFVLDQVVISLIYIFLFSYLILCIVFYFSFCVLDTVSTLLAENSVSVTHGS